MQVALFLLVIPLAHLGLQTSKFHGTGPNSRLVGALAAALVIGIGVVLAVPKLRA